MPALAATIATRYQNASSVPMYASNMATVAV